MGPMDNRIDPKGFAPGRRPSLVIGMLGWYVSWHAGVVALISRLVYWKLGACRFVGWFVTWHVSLVVLMPMSWLVYWKLGACCSVGWYVSWHAWSFALMSWSVYWQLGTWLFVDLLIGPLVWFYLGSWFHCYMLVDPRAGMMFCLVSCVDADVLSGLLKVGCLLFCWLL